MTESGLLNQPAGDREPPDPFNSDGAFDLLESALASDAAQARIGERRNGGLGEGRRSLRNGYPNKRVFTPASDVGFEARRPREESFESRSRGNGSCTHASVQEKILSMFARGMSGREIQCHLFELYGVDFSRDSIALVTDSVPDMIDDWRGRPLEASYPLVFFDALRVKIRDEGFVRNKVISIALSVQADGARDVLGLWIGDAEGADLWPRAIGELKERGIRDMLIAVADGLGDIHGAINAVFPRTIVQTCIVHLIRRSLDFPCWADRKALAGALKPVYRAEDANMAKAALDEFAAGQWGQKYPAIAEGWQRNWDRVVPFFAFPEAVRRIIYTRKAVESLNEKLRRAVRARGHFPSDESALFLVLRNAAGEGKLPTREWSEARTQLAAMFGARFVPA